MHSLVPTQLTLSVCGSRESGVAGAGHCLEAGLSHQAPLLPTSRLAELVWRAGERDLGVLSLPGLLGGGQGQGQAMSSLWTGSHLLWWLACFQGSDPISSVLGC